MSQRAAPGEDLRQRTPNEPRDSGFAVDLRRCIGCHACSVACKTAHDVPLGEFPLRVRWLPRPDGATYAFLPVFSERLCSEDAESRSAGLDPACVRACPTDAIVFGDRSDPSSPVARADLETLRGPDADDLKPNVVYRGLETWMANGLHRGAALDPRDEDPIYEQR